MTVGERFWQKVDRSGGPDACWPWLGGKCSDGYGTFWVGGKTVGAHRVAYTLLVGPVPDGLTLDHLCRARGCVNPAHLEPVVHRINVLRGASFSATNAQATHCPNGHPYDEKNTRFRPRGGRECRACHNRRTGARQAADRSKANATAARYRERHRDRVRATQTRFRARKRATP